MNEHLLRWTGYILAQFLLLVLSPVIFLLSACLALLKSLASSMRQAPKAPVHIHYELHQHIHMPQSNLYQQTLEQVSQHMPVGLQTLKCLPIVVKSEPVQLKSAQPREYIHH